LTITLDNTYIAGIWWVRVSHLFSFLCCPSMYLYVLYSVLRCPLRFLHKTIFGSLLHPFVCMRSHVFFYVICVSLRYGGIQHIYPRILTRLFSVVQSLVFCVICCRVLLVILSLFLLPLYWLLFVMRLLISPIRISY